ncbi:MAG: efflux RND transporter periplasmic adaptor subunit [Proteobacteria bacterium]|nr:efflux RND transporter periplasmic adaptor subunit [Pseudomonadota bacterium]
MDRFLLVTLASLWILSGCQQKATEQNVTSDKSADAPATFFVDGSDVVVMADDHRAKMLELHTMVYDDAPVLPPASATLAYDESKTVRVSSPLSGRILSDPLDLGTKINKGDVLLKLDSPDFNDALSMLEKAEANLNLTKEAFSRAKRLFDAKVMSRKDFEQAQDDVTNAQSEYDRARKFLEKLGVQSSGISAKTGAFHLRSPIAGTITEVNANPGMEVRPDLPNPLYVLSDLSRLWLWVDVFEKDIAKVQVGQPIRVKVSSWSDYEFYGHVDYISQIVNDATRSIRVRCSIDNPDYKLLPSMHAQVSIRNAKNEQSLLVPLTAVITEGDRNFVFVRMSDDRYHWQEVTLGIRFEQNAIVKTGLNKGDQVISNGALALRQDMLLANSAQTGN